MSHWSWRMPRPGEGSFVAYLIGGTIALVLLVALVLIAALLLIPIALIGALFVAFRLLRKPPRRPAPSTPGVLDAEFKVGGKP